MIRFPAAAACALALACGSPAAAAAAPGLVVVPRSAQASGLSYFRVAVGRGRGRAVGAVELRNPTRAPLRVRLSVVDGLTLSTLGSGYAPPGSAPHGSTGWIHLNRRLVSLAPGTHVAVPITIRVPAGARPGDFLTGISVEALDQRAQGLQRKGVAIASTSRYAIGLEVSVPGPRHPLIRFTGASIDRQPAGLIFDLNAVNQGNVVLQGVHGHFRVTRGGRVVLSRDIESGTFVSGTSISYPVTAFHEHPPEGTAYRVSAWLSYRGGVAHLDTGVTFGDAQASVQQHYASGTPASGASTSDWWKLAAVALVGAYALGTTVLLARRRSREARTAGET